MSIKRRNVIAGLMALALSFTTPFSAFAAQSPSVEYNNGDGQPTTKLTLIANDDNLANNNTEEWNLAHAKVEVPVAINYVAQSSGNILGPADNTAQIRNFAKFPVNVSNILVTSSSGATLVSTQEEANLADEIYLQMKPNSGTVISLADFTPAATESKPSANDGTGKQPTAGEWNIAAVTEDSSNGNVTASVLNLNSLGGHIGGFSNIEPASKTEIGQITWTVKAGSAAASEQQPVEQPRLAPKTQSASQRAMGSFKICATDNVTEVTDAEPGDEVHVVSTPAASCAEKAVLVQEQTDGAVVPVTEVSENISSFTVPEDAVEVSVVFDQQRSLEGTAYGVQDTQGNLVLLRSNNTYEYSTSDIVDVEDILGNHYQGYVTNVGTSNARNTDVMTSTSTNQHLGNSPRTVRVADGQAIQPSVTSNWFSGYSGLESVDLTGVDFSVCRMMSRMFANVNKNDETSSLVIDLSFAKTSNVTTKSAVTELFGQAKVAGFNFTGWDTSGMTDMSGMFSGVTCTGNIVGMETMDVSSTTTLAYMFQGFKGGGSTVLNVSNWKPVSATTATQMFLSVTGASVKAHDFGAPSITNMSSMFSNATLGSLDLGEFDCSGVTTMSSMFYFCTAPSLDVSGFHTQSAENMFQMFTCIHIPTLTGLDSFDTRNVTSMKSMFAQAEVESALDLSSFTVTNETDITRMCASANKIPTIYVAAGTDWKDNPTGDEVFYLAQRLVGGQGTAVMKTGKYDASYAHIDGGSSNPGYFTLKA